jgi:predicted metal-dependent HD superfamily phosphohydrolase
LIAYYQQPHRHYHNLEHILHCIGELQRMSLTPAQHKVLLAAIFFHDVIYRDPIASCT